MHHGHKEQYLKLLHFMEIVWIVLSVYHLQNEEHPDHGHMYHRLDFPPPTIEIEVLVPATPQITPEPDDLISEPDSTPSRPRPRARMPTSPPTPSPLEARRTRSRNVQSSAKHQAAGNKKNKAPPKWARKRTLRNRGGAGTAVPAAAPVGPTRPARRAAATLPPRTRYARGARFEGSYNEVDLAKRKRG
ncbi:hypothetical protein GQ44DRAFT_128708 [Phaeosphaeriaceae sp. PMI808]|nr:hypothetical protein GQ44DRAFT_128708 [Phaeosphaeriaceae sp. PMI808]